MKGAANQARRDRVVHAMTVVTWVVLVVGMSLIALSSTGPAAEAQQVLTMVLTTYFLVVITWLVSAAVADRSRRGSLILLAVGVALWGTGSAFLNGTTSELDLTKFPSPGEWFFLLSYVAMAAYLIIDAAHRLAKTLSTWLETVVICGGTACVAGAVLLTPLASAFGSDGVPLLLALLYPMIDAALGVLVIAQVALRARGGFRESAMLIGAFALFTYADRTFVANLASGVYGSSVLNDACYSTAFALLAMHATRRRTADARPPVRRYQTPAMVLGAGLAALTVLAIRPPGSVGDYLAVVALVTLVGVGGRLVVALRDANRATEAFALARSDDLTHLPNRRAILALTEEKLAADKPFSLMILDLNGFKEVNDTLGHAAGDSVLKLIAERVRESLPNDVMIARLGGDEFAAVVPSDDAVDAMEVAQEILRLVREPLTVDGIRLSIDASVGIAGRMAKDTNGTELLRRADVAMYRAKVNRAGALAYDGVYDDFSREKLQIVEQLRQGILGGELVLWYQPQIDAATQRICGLEALIRWNHPTEGLLSPAVFLPAARRAGLMAAISEEVARIAVNDLAEWRTRGLQPTVAINCAPPELLSGVFLPGLYENLQTMQVPASSVIIEVTEDSLIAEPERARTILQDIRAHDLQISIDDYGTGFSSLSYLRDLPVQELKIDRSFITGMTEDARSKMIVASTLQMAKALGLRTVAEGIEDAATAAELIALGVDVLQGYYFAAPMAPDLVEAWVWRWAANNTDYGYGTAS
jgi:diguanylate cyclase (GGDEF)-like protein